MVLGQRWTRSPQAVVHILGEDDDLGLARGADGTALGGRLVVVVADSLFRLPGGVAEAVAEHVLQHQRHLHGHVVSDLDLAAGALAVGQGTIDDADLRVDSDDGVADLGGGGLLQVAVRDLDVRLDVEDRRAELRVAPGVPQTGASTVDELVLHATQHVGVGDEQDVVPLGLVAAEPEVQRVHIGHAGFGERRGQLPLELPGKLLGGGQVLLDRRSRVVGLLAVDDDERRVALTGEDGELATLEAETRVGLQLGLDGLAYRRTSRLGMGAGRQQQADGDCQGKCALHKGFLLGFCMSFLSVMVLYTKTIKNASISMFYVGIDKYLHLCYS